MVGGYHFANAARFVYVKELEVGKIMRKNSIHFCDGLSSRRSLHLLMDNLN